MFDYIFPYFSLFFQTLNPGAGSDIRPDAVELPDNVDLDYFDRQDLGRLRRTIGNAVQSYQRERELYLEIVLQYFKVRAAGS